MRNIVFGDVTSDAKTFNPSDHAALLRTGGLVCLSALVTWLVGIIPGLDLGTHKETVLPIVMFGLEALRRWIGTQLPNQPQG